MSKNQDSIRSYYDLRYEGKSIESTAPVLRRVRSNLRGLDFGESRWFLDVGCGLGVTGLYALEEGLIPFGIDISAEASRTALQLGGYVATSQANAELLPFADASFDVAAFMGTLEHFVNPDRALGEARRVLRPGAQICFVLPNANFFLFKFFGGTEQPCERPRTYEGWHQLFEEEGFVIEKVYRDVGPGVFDGGPVWRGLLRRLVLSLSSLLPIHHTYQFVFICRSHVAPGAKDGRDRGRENPSG